MSRLPASRWLRIGAWTGAAVTWGTTVVVAREMAPAAAETPAPPEPQPIVESTTADAALPAMPNNGLVILRYTPIPDRQPKVITRYVTVAAPATPAPASGGTTTPPPAAPTGGGGGDTAVSPPPPPPPPAPTPTTTPPAPPSSGS